MESDEEFGNEANERDRFRIERGLQGRFPNDPTRRDEVEAEWRIITPIEEAWAHLPAPDFPNHAAGSEGSASWHELLEIRGSAEHIIGHRD